MTYVTSKIIRDLLADDRKVGSAITGAIGKVLKVDDNGFIFLKNVDSKKSLVALVPFDESDKIVITENDDGSVTLWNEELQPKKATPISSFEIFEKYIEWDGGNGDGAYILKALPSREELRTFTVDAFIDFFDMLKGNLRYKMMLNINQFMTDAAFELVHRFDLTPYQISNDFKTHRENWLKALESMKNNFSPLDEEDCEAHKSFWSNEIEVFNWSFNHLLAQGFEEIEVSKT